MMRVLLDECLPRKLKHHIVGHEVSTVQERGWSSKKNGELLRLMNDSVDVFLTSDQNLRYQQDLSIIRYSIVVLVARDNRLTTLQALIPQVQQVLTTITPGSVIEVQRES
jgi:predicted nuclease of predicted toxin-antitoxin system